MSVLKKAQIGSLVALKTLAAQRKCFVRVAISNYCGARLAWLWNTINSFEPLFPNFVGRLELFTTTGVCKKNARSQKIAFGSPPNPKFQCWKSSYVSSWIRLRTGVFFAARCDGLFPLTVNIEIRGWRGERRLTDQDGRFFCRHRYEKTQLHKII